MNVERDHVIHSRGGKLVDGVSSVADVERIVGRAVGNARPRGIAIHFHGGLVNQAAALGIARRLAPVYDGAGAYPIFFIWESGFIESLKNNLDDILRDKVFQELVKKAAEWALRKGAGTIATRGTGQQINVAQLRKDFDAWFAGSATPPIKLDSPG